MKNNYDANSIEIFGGLEGIKKRPEMYIGDISDGSGLHHLIFEIINNSIDEVMVGACNEIFLIINKNNSILIKDNGRGIPVDVKQNDKEPIKRSAVEIIFRELHSGGKFNNKNYIISGGLHGLGVSCLNALSEWIKIIIYRDKKIYFFNFYNSELKNKIIEKNKNNKISLGGIIGKTNKKGTEITFMPSKEIFKNIIYNEDSIKKKLEELSYLNKNTKLTFINKKNNKKKLFYNKEGIISFIKKINNKLNIINKKILYVKKKIKDIEIEIAIQWNNKKKENIVCYTNNICQKNGGAHLTGVKTGITKTINKYIKKKNIEVIGNDVREGIVCITSIKIKNPKFDSQVKDKLLNPEARKVTEQCTTELIEKFFKNNKKESNLLIEKIIKVAEIRNYKKKLRKTKTNNNIEKIKSNFSGCQEKNPNKSEIYIVEGDSAGGSAKQCRNKKFQAILPLRGKLLNVAKSKYKKLIKSKQILILINTLGCGIESTFNIKKIRYKKIIIMTDADIDGSHIRTLLLTFFYKYMISIIKEGYLYISKPPLYKIKYKKKEIYIKNDKKLNSFIFKLSIKNIKLKYIKNNKKIPKKIFKKFIKSQVKLNKIKENIKNKYNLNLFSILKYKINLNKIKKIIRYTIKLKNKKKHTKIKSKIIFNKNKNEINIELRIYKFNFFLKKIVINKLFLKNIKHKKLIQNLSILKIIKKNGIWIKKNNKIFKTFKFKKIINWLKKNTENLIKKQRYKGLGEMNPKQLWETTMDPKKRNLLQIKIKNDINTDKILSILMGNEVKKRKNFIQKNSLNIKKLDI